MLLIRRRDDETNLSRSDVSLDWTIDEWAAPRHGYWCASSCSGGRSLSCNETPSEMLRARRLGINRRGRDRYGRVVVVTDSTAGKGKTRPGCRMYTLLDRMILQVCLHILVSHVAR